MVKSWAPVDLLISVPLRKNRFLRHINCGQFKNRNYRRKLNIVQEGRVKKFIRELPEILLAEKSRSSEGWMFVISLSGRIHAERRRPAFNRNRSWRRLQKDILDKMDFTPVISPELN